MSSGLEDGNTVKRHEVIRGRFVLRSFVRRKDGILAARVRDMMTGKVRERWTRHRDMRKARAEILEWLDQVLEFERRQTVSLPFTDAFEDYLKRRTVRPITLAGYRSQYNQQILPEFGHRKLSEIAFGDVELFVARLKREEYSDRSICIYFGLLRQFFRWAKLMRYIVEDPTDGIRLPSRRSEAGGILTVDQARALLRAARDGGYTQAGSPDGPHGEWTQRVPPKPNLYLAILISLYTGLRRRNVLELRWEHVDLDAARIEITGHEMKSARTHAVPIHPVLLAELRDLAGRSPPPHSRRVLPTRSRNIWRSYRSALGLAGCPQRRWHDLRHTFASWISTTEPWVVVQALLGHAPRSVTDLYVHATWEQLVAGVGKLPDLTR